MLVEIVTHRLRRLHTSKIPPTSSLPPPFLFSHPLLPVRPLAITQICVRVIPSETDGYVKSAHSSRTSVSQISAYCG